MKAIQIPKPFAMEVTDIPLPTIKEDEILLKINYVGFCGSDLNTFRGGNTMVSYPRIPGHEIGATISEIGAAVPEGFHVGQVVTVNPYTNCGHCDACRNNRVNACENNETLGVQRNGAMQEYISLPWQKIIPADNLSLEKVALVEPLSVGFHAVDRGQVTDTDVVMVIGCGMVGLGAIIRSVIRGATVIVADIDDEKLALAKSLGATFTLNVSNNKDDKIPTPSVVIEAVGSVPTYQLAINSVGFTGRVVCIGYAKSDVSLPTSLFVKKELNICGSRNATPKDFEAVIQYLRQNDKINDNDTGNNLISSIIPPHQAYEAMQKWHESPGKVFRILVNFNN
ncbi:MAG: zinc-binding alcohol dehydrogenase family protein [Bacteroidaceae bacterium]|nr:zinc-binding alcohol dehydrogenase family protein [Bacteroidaceae bacterium]